jgi:hypothetical protein
VSTDESRISTKAIIAAVAVLAVLSLTAAAGCMSVYYCCSSAVCGAAMQSSVDDSVLPNCASVSRTALMPLLLALLLFLLLPPHTGDRWAYAAALPW